MPIFEYKCNTCEKTKDKLVSRTDADNAATFPCEVTEDCEGTLARSETPSAAELRFKGRWYSTTRSY